VTTSEIIHQIHELILEDHQISAKSIAQQLGISRERVLKCLNADQKVNSASRLSNFWNFFGVIQMIPVATGDHRRNLVISP